MKRIVEIADVSLDGVELEVTFEGSGSEDQDGNKLSYAWDFGDGETAQGSVVKHIYAKGGKYIAKLTVNDNTGVNCNASVATKTVILNRAPIADAGSDLRICVGDNVDFDASKSIDNDGDSLNYSWDFGDQDTSTRVNPTNTYYSGSFQPQYFKVTLTVQDDKGNTAKASATIEVLNK